MKLFLFSIFLLTSIVHAEEVTPPTNPAIVVDDSVKNEKIGTCIKEYIRKQSKTYSRTVQNNLYMLMNSLGMVSNTISFNNKIEALASIQCETYFNMGLLK